MALLGRLRVKSNEGIGRGSSPGTISTSGERMASVQRPTQFFCQEAVSPSASTNTIPEGGHLPLPESSVILDPHREGWTFPTSTQEKLGCGDVQSQAPRMRGWIVMGGTSMHLETGGRVDSMEALMRMASGRGKLTCKQSQHY